MNNIDNVSGISGGLSVNVKRWTYVCISLIVLVLIKNISPPASTAMIRNATLTPGGQNALAVLIFALLLWIIEAIPFHFIDLLAMALLVLFDVDSFESIVKTGFGNINVISFIDVFILSAFVNKSGLGGRLVNVCLSITGNSTKYVILGFPMVGALLPMRTSSMVVAVMLMSLAKSLLGEEGLRSLKNNFGKALLISVAWSSLISGSGAPTRNGPNLLATGFMKDIAGINVSSLDWMTCEVLISPIHIPVAWGLLLLAFKPEMKYLKRTNREIRNEFENQSKLFRNEKATSILFVATVAPWVFSSRLSDLLGVDVPIALSVVSTTMLFFFLGVSETKYREIEKEMSWSSTILTLSGVSLGMVFYQTRVANWIALGLLGSLGGLSPILTIFIVVLSVSLMNITLFSAMVPVSIVIPIIMELSIDLGISMLAIAFPAALTSSLALILITSTPTSAIACSAGYSLIKDSAKAGVPMSTVSCVIMVVVMCGVELLTELYQKTEGNLVMAKGERGA